jgi:hypothetical protein
MATTGFAGVLAAMTTREPRSLDAECPSLIAAFR